MFLAHTTSCLTGPTGHVNSTSNFYVGITDRHNHECLPCILHDMSLALTTEIEEKNFDFVALTLVLGLDFTVFDIY